MDNPDSSYTAAQTEITISETASPPTDLQVKLVMKAKNGDEQAFMELLDSCMPTIMKVVHGYGNKRTTLKERIHECKVALWERFVRNFNPAKATNFEGYLYRCLHSAMTDFINSRRPRSIYRDIRASLTTLGAEKMRFINVTGREMTPEEMAAYMDQKEDRPWTSEDINNLLAFRRANQQKSLSQPWLGTKDKTFADHLPCEKTPPPDMETAAKIDKEIIRDKVDNAITTTLNQRTGYIYRLRMGLSPARYCWKLQEIGDHMGCSRANIHSIVKTGHKKVAALLINDPVLQEMASNLEK